MNISRRLRDRRGATTVELAFVVPLILLFVFALIEWGRFEMVRQVTSTAAFNAARRGTIPGTSSDDVIQTADDILELYFVSDATTTTDITSERATITVEVPMATNGFVLNRFFGDVTISRDFTLYIK